MNYTNRLFVLLMATGNYLYGMELPEIDKISKIFFTKKEQKALLKEQKALIKKEKEKEKEEKERLKKLIGAKKEKQKLNETVEKKFIKMLKKKDWDNALEYCDDLSKAQLALTYIDDPTITLRLLQRNDKLRIHNSKIAKSIVFQNVKNTNDFPNEEMKKNMENIVTVLNSYTDLKDKFKLAKYVLFQSILNNNGSIFDGTIEWHQNKTEDKTEPLWTQVIHKKLALTPLMTAAMWGIVNITNRIFFSANIKSQSTKRDYHNIIVNAKDKKGNTPLMHAIRGYSIEPLIKIEAINQLLEYAPNVTTINDEGDSAFTLAVAITTDFKKELIKKMACQLQWCEPTEIQVLLNSVKAKYKEKEMPSELLILFPELQSKKIDDQIIDTDGKHAQDSQ